jgi:hypothetical protein
MTGLLLQLRSQGFQLWADGNRILVSPKERVTDGIRAAIRAHRVELLAELDRQHRVQELACQLRLYADHNGFTQEDFDEALLVAQSGDIDGWVAYLQGQNETRH